MTITFLDIRFERAGMTTSFVRHPGVVLAGIQYIRRMKHSVWSWMPAKSTPA
jgi:hypothetical protein